MPSIFGMLTSHIIRCTFCPVSLSTASLPSDASIISYPAFFKVIPTTWRIDIESSITIIVLAIYTSGSQICIMYHIVTGEILQSCNKIIQEILINVHMIEINLYLQKFESKKDLLS